MFYIVETLEQLEKVISYGNKEVFVDIIPADSRIHPALNKPSLIYFRPLTAKRGFILCIDHLEAFKLDYSVVKASLLSKLAQIWTIDTKTLFHYGLEDMPVTGLKMAYMLSGKSSFPELNRFATTAHRFYQRKLSNRDDINRFIPISKHYEQYEQYFSEWVSFISGTDWRSRCDVERKRDNEQLGITSNNFCDSKTSKVFRRIESSGIGINPSLFQTKYMDRNSRLCSRGDSCYYSYNLYNRTARPTVAGFGILSLSHEDDSRKIFVPRNDILIEFDYQAYQVKILAEMIGYQLIGSPHEELAKIYYETENISEEQYNSGKLLTFKYIYGRVPESELLPIDFFTKIYEFRTKLWEDYKKDGYIISKISGRRLYGIEEITQVLPHLMQCYETERNVMIMEKILDFLEGKKTKLVLYNYDAFLFDFSMEDGKEIITEIKKMLEEGGYKTTEKWGENYGEMEDCEI